MSYQLRSRTILIEGNSRESNRKREIRSVLKTSEKFALRRNRRTLLKLDNIPKVKPLSTKKARKQSKHKLNEALTIKYE